MYNYKLLIQYDGGRYKGWQRLGNNDNTIQWRIENVLSQLVRKQIEIVGSSRTDAGVHAIAQIANFKLDEHIPESEIMNYLNKYLPQDICIKEVQLVHENFHARYNVKEKTYLYKIWNNEYPNPFMRKYSMHVDKKLDIAKMEKASQYFIGSHDFTAFSNAKSGKKNMIREIYSILLRESDGFIEICVSGNGFLHNMVRRIVGTLIAVGLCEIDPEYIPEIINSKNRNHSGYMADACGLYLEDVKF